MRSTGSGWIPVTGCSEPVVSFRCLLKSEGFTELLNDLQILKRILLQGANY
jgi:hypothetical protein